MALRTYSGSDHTRIWEHLNEVVQGVRDLIAEQLAKRPYASATGTVDGGQQSGRIRQVTVAFPSGRFTKVPEVVASMKTGGGTDRAVVAVSNITTSGFQMTFIGTNGQTLGNQWCIASWIAIQQEA